uniref:Glycine N-acyltransferase-like protein n=2 Tax=Octopus bimaculoides TaxID=37653 RepID=A0A0L8GA32_OCTBM
MKSKDKCVKKCDMYNLYHLDENSLQSSVAPTNLDIGVLTTEHLDDIADTWEQSSTDQVDSTKEYINVLINTFPNVCLCNSIEKVVAYGLGTDSGTIGYLHVNANYRGRGCTKAVISMLSAKFIEAGITPSVKIQPENILSISVHEQIGYQSSGIVVYDMEF